MFEYTEMQYDRSFQCCRKTQMEAVLHKLYQVNADVHHIRKQ